MRAVRFIVIVSVFFACGLSASALPGDHDEQALGLLQKVTGVLKLGVTQLKEVAPRYVSEKKEGLSWAEAVTEANARHGSRQPDRAVFLYKYLAQGSRQEDLAELQLTDAAVSTITGSGRSRSLLFIRPEKPHEPRPPTQPGHVTLIGLADDKADARITVWVSGEGRLTGEPTFDLLHAKVGGVEFDSLGFDAQGRLTAWYCRTLFVSSTGAKGDLGGNQTGEAGTRHFWASLRADGEEELITYDPHLLITRRSVSTYDTATLLTKTNGKHYMESYENGRLRKRMHYGERDTKDGTETIVIKEETF